MHHPHQFSRIMSELNTTLFRDSTVKVHLPFFRVSVLYSIVFAFAVFEDPSNGLVMTRNHNYIITLFFLIYVFFATATRKNIIRRCRKT